MKNSIAQKTFRNFLEAIARELAPKYKGKLKIVRGHINQPPYFQNSKVQCIYETFFTKKIPIMMVKEGFDFDSSGYSLKIVYYDKNLKDALDDQVQKFVKDSGVKRIDYIIPK